MSVFQQGRNAGGWTGTTVAGQNIIPTLLEHEKQNADAGEFHRQSLCVSVG